MKRTFEEIMGSLKETIANYGYYVDFKKVSGNVKKFTNELNLLNGLIGSDDIETKFNELITEFPKIITALPILLAARDKKITIYDADYVVYNFEEANIHEGNQYEFLEKSGLIDLLRDRKITSFVDYVYGVEVGLDTNARKNRSGKIMESRVEKYLKESDCVYLAQATSAKVKKKWTTDILSQIVYINNKNRETKKKKFDFVAKTANGNFLLIEVNYYGVSGSKPTSIAESYTKLGNKIKEFEGLNFIWITDGKGWDGSRNDFEEAYEQLEHVYTLKDLEDGIIPRLIAEL
ncbi:MAG: type II restriction endonuclease [Fusobacteriaceae bacterium]